MSSPGTRARWPPATHPVRRLGSGFAVIKDVRRPCVGSAGTGTTGRRWRRHGPYPSTSSRSPRRRATPDQRDDQSLRRTSPIPCCGLFELDRTAADLVATVDPQSSTSRPLVMARSTSAGRCPRLRITTKAFGKTADADHQHYRSRRRTRSRHMVEAPAGRGAGRTLGTPRRGWQPPGVSTGC